MGPRGATVYATAWRLRAEGDGAAVGSIVGALRALLDAEGSAHVPIDAWHLEAAFFGYRFHLDRYALEVVGFDVAFRLLRGTEAVVTWRGRDGERRVFLGPGSAFVLQPLLAALLAAVDGDAFELDYTLAARHPIFPGSTFLFPDGWWSSWKDRSLEGGEAVGAIYEREIHPWVRRLLDQAPPVHTARRVVDWCGGDGTSLRAMRGCFPDAEPLVLDRNVDALAAASASGLPVARADVTDAAAVSAAIGGPVDLILAVGALCSSVLPPERAADAADALAVALAPGGIAVLAGWTPALLTADDWRRRGLVVFNCTRPAPADVWVGQQLYGLWRPLVSGR